MAKNITDIARDHGVELTRQGKGEWRGRCPHPDRHTNGDANPSCDLNDAKNTYFCRSCNAGGGARAYEQALQHGANQSAIERSVASKQVTAEMRAQATRIHEMGQAGLLPGSIGEGLLAVRRLTAAVALATYIGVAEFTGGNEDGMTPGRCYAFTTCDTVGPTHVKLRSVDDKHSQRVVPAGAPQRLFLGHMLDPTKPVVLTEGEFDATALVAVGVENVASVPNGAGTAVTPELLAPIGDAPTIYIATDNDAAGTELAHRLARGLGFPRCRRVTFGPHKDANDALMAGASPEHFAGWFAAATPMTDPTWEAPMGLDDTALPTFPIEALDGVLGQMAAAVAEFTQTPVDMAAMLMLGIVAMLTAPHFKVRAGNHVEPTNLYVMVGMDSGNRKSSVLGALMEPIERHLQEHKTQIRASIQDATSRQRIAANRLKEAERVAVRAQGAEEMAAAEAEVAAAQRALQAIEIPRERRLFTTDPTPEVLVPLTQDNDGCMAVVDSEGTSMRTMGGRYASKPNFDVYLSAHGGDRIQVDRKNGPPLSVVSPALTLALAVQPDVIRQLGAVAGARTSGFLARFLYTIPGSFLGRRRVNAPPVPHEVALAYAAMLGWLLALSRERDANGVLVRETFVLDVPALVEFTAMCEALEPRLGPFGDLVEIVEWSSKLPGAVLRLAAILHAAKFATAEPDSGLKHEIDVHTLRSARRIGDYLTEHALAAFNLMGMRQPQEDARYLRSHIARNVLRRFSARELFQLARGRIDTMERFDKALGVLVEHGLVRKAASAQTAPSAGRPASAQYAVNPLWLPQVTQPQVAVAFRQQPDASNSMPAATPGPVTFLVDEPASSDRPLTPEEAQ